MRTLNRPKVRSQTARSLLSTDTGTGRRPQDEAPCHMKIFSPVLKAEGLTKRHRSRQALTHCRLRIPRGRLIGSADSKANSVPTAHSETTGWESARRPPPAGRVSPRST
jgi:hypothetical protein